MLSSLQGRKQLGSGNVHGDSLDGPDKAWVKVELVSSALCAWATLSETIETGMSLDFLADRIQGYLIDGHH